MAYFVIRSHPRQKYTIIHSVTFITVIRKVSGQFQARCDPMGHLGELYEGESQLVHLMMSQMNISYWFTGYEKITRLIGRSFPHIHFHIESSFNFVYSWDLSAIVDLYMWNCASYDIRLRKNDWINRPLLPTHTFFYRFWFCLFMRFIDYIWLTCEIKLHGCVFIGRDGISRLLCNLVYTTAQNSLTKLFVRHDVIEYVPLTRQFD